MTALCRKFGRSPPGSVSEGRLIGAFTLVELLVVLTIIGVMTAGMVVVFASNRSQVKIRVAAQDLGTAIAFAREESTAFGTSFRVVFGADQHRYRVERLTMGWANADTPEDAFVPVAGAAGRWRVMDSEIRIGNVQVRGVQRKQSPHSLLFSGIHEGFSGQIEVESGATKWRIEVSDGGSVSVAALDESASQ
jgi:prepilin-type N-terminal cleavage/methylation domain-containing protein